jgi:hypothetical protein
MTRRSGNARILQRSSHRAAMPSAPRPPQIPTDGGKSGAGGYSIVSADSLSDAAAKAKGCPVLASGGSVENYEAVELLKVTVGQPGCPSMPQTPGRPVPGSSLIWRAHYPRAIRTGHIPNRFTPRSGTRDCRAAERGGGMGLAVPGDQGEEPAECPGEKALTIGPGLRL